MDLDAILDSFTVSGILLRQFWFGSIQTPPNQRNGVAMTYVARYDLKDSSREPPSKLIKWKEICVMGLIHIIQY